MDLNLEGKRALVTGSSGGIGAGIARMLACEGAAVVVHARNRARAGQVAEAIQAAGGRAAVATGDLASDSEATSVAEAAASAVRLIKMLAEPMRQRGWGRIINISSLGGQSTSGQRAEYAAAKAAMNNLTVGLAKVLDKTGVTVNTVSPGMVATGA